MRCVELVVGCNEASDLLPVRSPDILAAYGWRRAFWTVLDEGPVERCLALLGLRDGEERWDAHVIAADAGDQTGRTEDGEALAYHDGWVYVIGSHFGSKRGPLRPRRGFVARFREADAALAHPVPVQVVRNQFRLHRAVNDALRSLDTLPPHEVVHHRFIAETLTRGAARAKGWVERITHGDVPMNIEAAAFTPDGTLLLGLRFPVTVAGEPIVVAVAGVDAMFTDPPAWPTVVGAYVLAGVTPAGALSGFRALSARGDGSYDAVIGSIDATGKESVLLDAHPTGGDVPCRHIRFAVPPSTDPADPAPRIAAEVVAELAPFRNVEGVAESDGLVHYVTDEDHRVALWTTT